MEQILVALPSILGLDPGTFALLLGIVMLAANVTSKVIPESATGTLGVVRKISSIIGVSLSNRITPNVTQKDISKAVAAGIPDASVKAAAESLSDAVETGVGSAEFAASVVAVGAAHESQFAEHNRPGE